MPRQARRKSSSGIYHVMLRGINLQQIFYDDEDYKKFLNVVKECKAISEFKLYAYCLMGNHIHLLVEEVVEPIAQIIKRIATRFVYWYNIKYQRTGHLFQDRYKSEAVEDDSYFMTAMRYIHQNPVKANICEKIGMYKYSSYNEYLGVSNLIDREFVFEMVSKSEFIRFNNEESSAECLDVERKPTAKVTDEQAQKLMEKISKCQNASQFQMQSEALRNKNIRKLHENGLSIRQICRLCGESKGIVEKCLRIS